MNLKSENMILDLLVQTDAEGIVELESTAGRVRMIPFSGTVTGPLFQGRIEPCGVDTQITNAADVRHMSARYMLTGVDHTGSPCHIYVQNEAWFTDGARPRPWHRRGRAAYPVLSGGLKKRRIRRKHPHVRQHSHGDVFSEKTIPLPGLWN